MRSFHSVIARSAREIGDAQRVRHRVYVEEEAMRSASDGGRDADAYDERAGTVHFLVYDGDEPVGTVRLLSPERGAGLGLPLEDKLELAALGLPGAAVAEVTRFCVLRRYRHTGVTTALFQRLYLESARRAITHWIAGANMETDAAEDAALAHRLAAAQGLVRASCAARPGASGAQPPAPPRRPLYTPEQRRRAAQGDLAAIELPPTIALFARRMGARFIGAPLYDALFRVFALPLVATLAEIAAQRERPGRGRPDCVRLQTS